MDFIVIMIIVFIGARTNIQMNETNIVYNITEICIRAYNRYTNVFVSAVIIRPFL